MGWRIRIDHTTKVKYAGPVLTSFNEARMTPLTLPSQMTLESRVTAGPGVPVWTYSDYWGTYVSVFDLPEPHDDLEIRATSTVETEPLRGIPAAGARPSWAQLREQASGGRLLEFLLPTALTTVPSAVWETALADISSPSLSPDDTAAAISDRVRSHVTYMPGATGVRTNAQEAWDKGQGVCQDMAQLTVALMRAAGLPARYISGYLHPDTKAEPGQAAVGQSHAWVEYWAGTWTPLDPTSGAPVGERHVVVARGRDYADVPPLKGIYHGPAAGDMRVTVEVTRLALTGAGRHSVGCAAGSSLVASISSVTRTASGTMKPPAANATYPNFSTSKSLRLISVVAVRPSRSLFQTSVITPFTARSRVCGRVMPWIVRSPSTR